jgi:hypothetical protein
MPLLSSLAGKARFAGKLEPAGFGLPDETPAAWPKTASTLYLWK